MTEMRSGRDPTLLGAAILDLGISPRGDLLAFLLTRPRRLDRAGTHGWGPGKLYLCEISSRALRQLDLPDQSDWSARGLSWSPDSAFLSCTADAKDGSQALLLIAVDDSSTGKAISSHKYKFTNPKWSPRGDQICFLRFGNHDGVKRAELVSFKVDTQQMEVILSLEFEKEVGGSSLAELPGYSMAWNRSGDRVLITAGHGGPGQTVVVRVSDGSVMSRRKGVTGARWVGADQYSYARRKPSLAADAVHVVEVVDASTGAVVEEFSAESGLEPLNLPSPDGEMFLFRDLRTEEGNDLEACYRVFMRSDAAPTDDATFVPRGAEVEWLPDQSGCLCWISGTDVVPPKILVAKFNSDSPTVVVGVDDRPFQQFASSDAWILVAAASYGDSELITLDQLVASADSINHAIPTRDEIESGINRLLEAGVIEVRDEKFKLTRAGSDLYEKARSRKDVFASWERAYYLLETSVARVPRESRWTLDEDAYSRSCELYYRNIGLS